MFFRKARRIEKLEKVLACARNDIQEIKLALIEARVANFIVVVDYVPGMKLTETKPTISLEELQGRIEALEKGMDKKYGD